MTGTDVQEVGELPLFKSAPQPKDSIVRFLISKDQFALKRAAQSQDAILQSLQPGEWLRAIAVDHGAQKYVVATTNRRALVYRSNKFLLKIEPHDILETYGARHPNLGVIAVIKLTRDISRELGSPGVATDYISIAIGDESLAFAYLKVLRNQLVYHNIEKAIPDLNDDFFGQILTQNNMAIDKTNLAWVADLFARMIIRGGALAYLDETNDDQAKIEFQNRFSNGGTAERKALLCNDLIEWLWDFDPQCRESLSELIEKLKETLTDNTESLVSIARSDWVPQWSEIFQT